MDCSTYNPGRAVHKCRQDSILIKYDNTDSK